MEKLQLKYREPEHKERKKGRRSGKGELRGRESGEAIIMKS